MIGGVSMIHGVYMKSRPKSRWQLVSVKISAESALKELNIALKQAKMEGNEQAEATVQVFDCSFYIPESLDEVKDQKLIFN